MPQFQLESLRSAKIHIRSNVHPAVAFAAQELRKYLQRLTGIDVPVHDGSEVGGRTTLTIGVSPVPGLTPRLPERGAYAIRPEARQISLFGGSPRAVLAAAYALLEQCGCAWSLHDPDEEIVPDLRAQSVAELAETAHTPAFRLRGYCSDIMTWHYTQPEHFRERLPEDRKLIDWMGKSGASTFFYIRHPFDTQLSIPELSAEFAQRAIDVEYGGHVIPLLMPRELFGERPDFFPQARSGERVDHGNLCTSSADALALAATNALAYVHEHPEMSALHIWGADLWEGGWCHCPSCAAVGAQDQSLRVCNAVAAGLAAADRARPVCYLAYHDTLDAQLTVRPDPMVFCEWAPRERCYGHALDDNHCERNRRYRASLERHLQWFDGRVRLFEYYGDAILYFGCALPLAELVAADMEYYRRIGIREGLMLQFGAYSTWAHPLSFLAFANATTTGSVSPAALRTSYCRRFGPDAEVAATAFAEIEHLMAAVVRYGDIRIPPRDEALAATIRAAIAATTPRLSEWVEQLGHSHNPALRSQGDLLRYTLTVLEGVAQDIDKHGSGEVLFARALALIEAAERRFKGSWGAVDLPIIHSFYSARAQMAD